MGWFRIDDRSTDHPKFLALSDGAFRLWVEGGVFCNRHLTNGLILRAALNGFRYVSRKRTDELVAVSLWDRVPDGFQMHDYLEWNESKEHVERKRLEARQRAEVRRKFARTSHERTPNSPLGVGGISTDLQDQKEKKADAFAEFWRAYPRKVGKAAAERAFLKAGVPVETLIAAIARHQRTPQWTKDGGQFIPHPASWLNGKRWEDEIAAAPQTASYAPTAHADYDRWPAECRELHGNTCGNYQTHYIKMQRERLSA